MDEGQDRHSTLARRLDLADHGRGRGSGTQPRRLRNPNHEVRVANAGLRRALCTRTVQSTRAPLPNSRPHHGPELGKPPMGSSAWIAWPAITVASCGWVAYGVATKWVEAMDFDSRMRDLPSIVPADQRAMIPTCIRHCTIVPNKRVILNGLGDVAIKFNAKRSREVHAVRRF